MKRGMKKMKRGSTAEAVALAAMAQVATAKAIASRGKGTRSSQAECATSWKLACKRTRRRP